MMRGYLTGLAAALLASSAGAVTIDTGTVAANATHVTLTHSLPGGPNSYIQIGELQAFTFASVNVAQASNGGLATGTAGFATSTSFANDGNTNRFNNVGPIFLSGNGSGDFLRIDFSAPATLASLVIHGRSDCCVDRNSWLVTLFSGSASLWSGLVDATDNSIATVNFAAPPTTGAVPEPTSWLMLLTGFGLVAAALRRTRQQGQSAAALA